MSNNRIEQLESTVAELESTVDGLTDELIEAKERVRVLEAELDTESPSRVPDRRGGTGASDADTTYVSQEPVEADEAVEETTDGETTDAEEPEDSPSDEIIVA